MKPKNVLNIQICQLLDFEVIPHRYEVSYLGKSVNNHPDRVMAFRGLRQTRDEVHGYALPLPHRDI
jgi:hypothetical protein